METISNAANAASKMIWGDQTTTTQSGTEPISGQQGRGTATDPFDAGNKEENITPKEKRSDSAHSHNEKPDLGMKNLSLEQKPEQKLEQKPDLTPSDRPKETTETQHKGHIGGAGIDPSMGADPKSAQKPIQKQQGADRPADEPSGMQTDAIRNKKDMAEETMKIPTSTTDGPSEPPMGMSNSSSPSSSLKSPGGPMSPENKPKTPEERQKENEEKGTGEKWIKTSGLAADGGDFDASKAGAGREADRLLETKGIRSSDESSQDSPPPLPKERTPSPKQGMGQKLKEKLHIRKH